MWSIAKFGITSVGLDKVSATKFRGQLLKERRTVGRSPAHMSHETSSQLLARLHCMDPIGVLLTQTQTCVHLCARAVAHLQTLGVQQWQNLLILSTEIEISEIFEISPISSF